MNVRKLIIGAVTLAAVLCVPVANATLITWKLIGVTFDDGVPGATASGTFSADNVTGALGDWDITTAPGSLPGSHYSSGLVGQTGLGLGGLGFTLCTVAGCGSGFELDMEFSNSLLGNPPNSVGIVFANSGEVDVSLGGKSRGVDSGHIKDRPLRNRAWWHSSVWVLLDWDSAAAN